MSEKTWDGTESFTPLEESVSFYTRNDYALMYRLMAGKEKEDGFWEDARLAYGDNRGILEEYENGTRRVESDYDVKWINALKKRLIDDLDDAAKERIIRTAREDISRILGAMRPAEKDALLYRTVWVRKEEQDEKGFPFSPGVFRLPRLTGGEETDIVILSSFSRTPYEEDRKTESGFYRYELPVPAGMPVLELDPLITHNEEGEVILPPMRCRVRGLRESSRPHCRCVVELEYREPLCEDPAREREKKAGSPDMNRPLTHGTRGRSALLGKGGIKPAREGYGTPGAVLKECGYTLFLQLYC